MRRRAWRLLPAYYASMVVAYLVAVPLLHLFSYYANPFEWVTHLTMTHTLFYSTYEGINGVYWSLGLEAQFYLAMFVLVFWFHRWGIVRAMALTLAITLCYRYAILLKFPHTGHELVIAGNFFLGRWIEFAFGMALAAWYVDQKEPRVKPTNPFAQTILLMGALLLPVAREHLGTGSRLLFPWQELLWTLPAVVLIWFALDPTTWFARLLRLPTICWAGRISYSLYLIHFPILWFVQKEGARMGLSLSGASGTLALITVCLPLSLLAAAGFYQVFEEPFLHGRPISDDGSRHMKIAGPFVGG